MKLICTLLSMSLWMAWPSAAPGQAPSSTAAAPTVDQILDKFAQAIGGKAALERLSSRVIKGNVEMAGLGMSFNWESYAKAPAKRLSIVEVMALGTILEGCNGKTAWSKNPMSGLTEKKGEELAKACRDADFYRDVNFKKIYPNLVGKEPEQVAEEPAHVLEAKPSPGSLERFYFSTKTGLLVRQDSEFEAAEGKGKTRAQALLEDYRVVDGIKMPFTTTIKADVPGQPEATLTIKIIEIKHNVPIDDAKFEKPNA